jgi:hypothetical protein
MDTLPECPYRGEKIVYDQKKVYSNSCFFVSAVGAISDVYGVKIDLDVLKANFQARILDKGLYSGTGGSFIDGVNAARRMWNELNPDRPVCSFRVPVGGPEFSKTISKGYSVCIGVRVSPEYWRDVLNDGIVQEDSPAEKNSGHFVRTYSPMKVLDNFPESLKSLNSYVYDDFGEKIKKGLIMPFSYFFAPLPYNAQTINDLPADQRKEAFDR